MNFEKIMNKSLAICKINWWIGLIYLNFLLWWINWTDLPVDGWWINQPNSRYVTKPNPNLKTYKSKEGRDKKRKVEWLKTRFRNGDGVARNHNQFSSVQISISHSLLSYKRKREEYYEHVNVNTNGFVYDKRSRKHCLAWLLFLSSMTMSQRSKHCFPIAGLDIVYFFSFLSVSLI